MKNCFQLLTLFISHLKEIEVPTGKCVSSNEHYLSNMHWFVLELYKSKHVCILELFSIILCFVIFSLEIITYVCIYINIQIKSFSKLWRVTVSIYVHENAVI